MPKDKKKKFPASKFSCQMETIVFVIIQQNFTTLGISYIIIFQF